MEKTDKLTVGNKEFEMNGNNLWIENKRDKKEIRLSLSEAIQLRNFLNQLDLD